MISLIYGPLPDHIWATMDENFNRKAEKLIAWLEKEWPSKNEYGLPEGLRVFVLSPEDIAYIAADQLNEKGVKRLVEMDARDIIHAARKRLEAGIEDWSELLWDTVYYEFMGGAEECEDDC